LHAENGEMVLLEATPRAYREAGRFTPQNRPTGGGQAKAWPYPVLANGRLYVRELNCLWCYDVKAAK
jgi:outer membrane protein assembly factor BamB